MFFDKFDDSSHDVEQYSFSWCFSSHDIFSISVLMEQVMIILKGLFCL